ncbi:MAG: CoA-binding protein [Spirochaetota bacterium]|nr:CoA-binding protein [Spirochaetota bacterium]
MKQNVFAVIGVSSKPDKYGYKIYKHLKHIGKKVYPIHPAVKDIEGDVCYKKLSDIPDRIDVVDIVVPPHITEQIVEECHRLGIRRVWIQPGAESDKAIQYCKDNNIDVVYNTCIMLHS